MGICGFADVDRGMTGGTSEEGAVSVVTPRVAGDAVGMVLGADVDGGRCTGVCEGTGGRGILVDLGGSGGFGSKGRRRVTCPCLAIQEGAAFLRAFFTNVSNSLAVAPEMAEWG